LPFAPFAAPTRRAIFLPPVGSPAGQSSLERNPGGGAHAHRNRQGRDLEAARRCPAHQEKNAAKIVSNYNKDAVVFDLSPPLLSPLGTDANAVQGWLDTWDGPDDQAWPSSSR
jgi:hypothetical protein